MSAAAPPGGAVRLFLCGDVMTGRGIDQVLPHPLPPHLYERWVQSATTYVQLCEQRCGAIGRGLEFCYPWGDALAVLEQLRPALRIVNLETAVTLSEEAQPDKGIHYRMHPANLPCLTGAGIDCCVLANNHVLDWGAAGLLETLSTLRAAGLRTAGAGRNALEAAAPAALALPQRGRLLVFAVATPGSGVPPDWAATARRPGVHFLDDLSAESGARLAAAIAPQRQPGDLVVLSIHWGGNWGHAIPPEHRSFAHALIASGAVDLIHGHSSHHVKALEMVQGKLVLYGCGDFINDYEGIAGWEQYQPELALMYFPALDRATGALVELLLAPMRRHRLRLQRASPEEAARLAAILQHASRPFEVRVAARADALLALAA